jgi:hypothetical protein
VLVFWESIARPLNSAHPPATSTLLEFTLPPGVTFGSRGPTWASSVSSGTDAAASLTRASVEVAKHGTHGVLRHTTQVNSGYRAV